jgi:MFS family permease
VTGSGRRAWAVVALLWVAYFLNYTDRQVVFAIFPVFRRELGFTEAQLGLVGSVFLWVYGLTSPVAGQIGDWVSKRLLVALSLGLWSAATALTGLSRSPETVLACRALIGVVEGLFMPAAVALVASAHAPETRSRAMGVLSTAQLAGVVMGGSYGGWMAEGGHWRRAFFSLGLAGVLFAGPFAAGLRRLGEGPAEAPREGRPLAFAALARVPSYGVLCIVYPTFCFALWLVYSWLPDYFHGRFGLSLGEAGFASTAYAQGATFVGLVAGGAAADRLYRRVPSARFLLVAAGLAAVSPCLFVLARTASFGTAKAAAAGFGFGCGLFIANLFVSSFDVVPAGARASAVGWLNLLGCLVSGCASYLGGAYRGGAGVPALMSGAAVACLAAALVLAAGTAAFFKRDHDRARAEGEPRPRPEGRDAEQSPAADPAPSR